MTERCGTICVMICPQCKIDKPVSEYHRNPRRKRGHDAQCAKCKNKKAMDRYYANHEASKARSRSVAVSKLAKLRLEVITAYGGQCACCGELEIDFLVLDHINGGGTQERKRAGKAGGGVLYNELRKAGFPQGGIQVLCANCNMAKERNRGCPHQYPMYSNAEPTNPPTKEKP